MFNEKEESGSPGYQLIIGNALQWDNRQQKSADRARTEEKFGESLGMTEYRRSVQISADSVNVRGRAPRPRFILIDGPYSNLIGFSTCSVGARSDYHGCLYCP